MTVTVREAPAAEVRSVWRQVAVPTEHGGWGLTAEPVLLALLVAWSWSGLAFGVAAIGGFLVRTPLKIVLVDRWRGRWLPRTTAAAKVVAAELAVMVALTAVAAFGAEDQRFWIPLVLAVPLVVLGLWFDMRSKSRRIVPELAGAIGISSVAAAIALIGGAGMALSLGLWAVVAARAVAAIPYVRTQVLRRHDRPCHRGPSDAAQLAAVALVAVAWRSAPIPLAAVVAVAAIAVFNVVSMRLDPRTAKVIGFLQMGFGLALVAVTAIGLWIA